MKNHLLTFDITEDTVRFADIAMGTRGQLSLVKTGVVVYTAEQKTKGRALPGPANLYSELQRALIMAKIKTRRCAVSIQNPRLVLRRLAFPPISLLQLRKMLVFELGRYIPYSPEESVCDLISLSLTPKEHTALLAAAPKDLVDSMLTAFQRNGRYPRLLEPGIISLYRWIQYQCNIGQNNLLLLDLRERLGNVLVAAAGQPVVVRTIPRDAGRPDNDRKLIADIAQSVDFAKEYTDLSTKWFFFSTSSPCSGTGFKPRLEEWLGVYLEQIEMGETAIMNDVFWGTNLGLALGWNKNRHDTGTSNRPTKPNPFRDYP